MAHTTREQHTRMLCTAGLMAALAYLLRNIDILHTEEMEAEVMRAASRSGLIDMTGSLLPGIDGFNLKMNVSIQFFVD